MDNVLIELQAVAPQANRFRRWRIEFARDLFGVLTAQVSFGRIGCAGSTGHWAFADVERARWFLRAKLRRRATGPRRIGATYEVIDASISAWPFLDAAGLRRAEAEPVAAVAADLARQSPRRAGGSTRRIRHSLTSRPSLLL